jgi:hypothetical protein
MQPRFAVEGTTVGAEWAAATVLLQEVLAGGMRLPSLQLRHCSRELDRVDGQPPWTEVGSNGAADLPKQEASPGVC